jgi:hypothetical protein
MVSPDRLRAPRTRTRPRRRPSDFANAWLWSAPRLRGRLRAVDNIERGLRRTGCPRFLAGGVLEHWSIRLLRLIRIAPA